VCCPRWTDHFSIGNIFKAESLDDVWNSSKAQELRSSILSGAYTYCDFNYCSQDIENAEQEHFSPIIQAGPEVIVCDYDPSCSLSCWMCREGKMMLSREKQQHLIDFQKRLITSPLFRDVKRLVVTTVGDPFASNIFWSLFEDIAEGDFDNLKLRIRTHGLALTPRNWKRLGRTADKIDQLYISADGATAETYESIRVGGSFAQLEENLAFLEEVRKTRYLQLMLFYTVMDANFREIPQFIEFGKRYGVDRVIFQKLYENPAFSGERYDRQAIHLPQHPHFQELLAVLRDPKCDQGSVAWANLKDLREYAGKGEMPHLGEIPVAKRDALPILGQQDSRDLPYSIAEEDILSLIG
jgi:MoaA/NifB/PqqE/SkfB family radical SAM enzyme